MEPDYWWILLIWTVNIHQSDCNRLTSNSSNPWNHNFAFHLMRVSWTITIFWMENFIMISNRRQSSIWSIRSQCQSHFRCQFMLDHHSQCRFDVIFWVRRSCIILYINIKRFVNRLQDTKNFKLSAPLFCMAAGFSSVLEYYWEGCRLMTHYIMKI